MRTTRLSAVLIALLLVSPAAFLALPSAPVHACSIGSFGTPERQVQALLDAIQDGDVVLVGDVLDERRVGKIGENDVYMSNVRPASVLMGDVSGSDLEVRTVAFESKFCSGTQRLLEGENVLLVLDWKSTGSVLKGDAPNAWTLGHFLGKVRLDEEVAVSQYANTGMAIGTPEEAIRRIGAHVNAAPEAIEAVIAALARPVPEASDSSQERVLTDGEDNGTPITGYLAVLGGAVVVTGLGVLAYRRQHMR